MQVGYAELFKTFPDANRKDTEALTNFFKAKTTVGDAVVKQMVATFRALSQYGHFDSTDASVQPMFSNGSQKELVDQALPASPAIRRSRTGPEGMTINLNVELVVPTDLTGDVYDKFFSAMKKHLFDAAE